MFTLRIYLGVFEAPSLFSRKLTKITTGTFCVFPSHLLILFLDFIHGLREISRFFQSIYTSNLNLKFRILSCLCHLRLWVNRQRVTWYLWALDMNGHLITRYNLCHTYYFPVQCASWRHFFRRFSGFGKNSKALNWLSKSHFKLIKKWIWRRIQWQLRECTLIRNEQCMPRIR